MSHNILLVEDHPIVAMSTRCLLRAQNEQVTLAETGQQAFDLILQQSFKIIFIDIGLPDFDGLEVISRIKKYQHPNKKTSIFILTAHDESTYRQHATELNVHGYLLKPLTVSGLKDIFKNHCSRQICFS